MVEECSAATCAALAAADTTCARCPGLLTYSKVLKVLKKAAFPSSLRASGLQLLLRAHRDVSDHLAALGSPQTTSPNSNTPPE